jgi:Ca-activated chloride channel homolog
MKYFFTILILCSARLSTSAQAPASITQGNQLYLEGNFGAAETEYRKALEEEKENQIARFNLANTLIKEKKSDDAGKLLSDLRTKENPVDIRAKASYNLGVIFTQNKKLEESIEAYKAALRNDPNDQQARENLEKAMMEFKKKSPPKKENKEKKNEPKKQPPKPKLNPKEVRQHLQLLEQKEKQVQQRLLQNNSRNGTPQPKDW